MRILLKTLEERNPSIK